SESVTKRAMIFPPSILRTSTFALVNPALDPADTTTPRTEAGAGCWASAGRAALTVKAMKTIKMERTSRSILITLSPSGKNLELHIHLSARSHLDHPAGRLVRPPQFRILPRLG